MKLSELITEVNKDIDDSLGTGEIIGWLNRALDDLSTVAGYQVKGTIVLQAGVSEYNLPSDHIKTVHLFDGTNELDMIRTNDFESAGYKRWGKKIAFQPAPDTGKSLDHYYHARLPHLSSQNINGEPELPAEFHDLLVIFAVAKAKYQDEEESLQQNAMIEYYRRKRDLEAYVGERDFNDTVQVG